jgi:quercetin dioxygenase-like cupin family protein
MQVSLQKEMAMAEVAPALVLAPGQGRVLPAPGMLQSGITLKVGEAATGGALTVYESLHEPDNPGTVRHVHQGWTEMFYMLEGQMTFLVGGKLHRVSAGSFILVPPGVVHAFRNTGSERARLLVIVVPGGFEHYFEEMPGLPADMTDPAWRELTEKWDGMVVGPPIER